MKKIGLSLMAFVLFMIHVTSANAQITSRQIDKLLQNTLLKFNVAGAGVAVVKDGKVVHLKAYGITSIKTKKLWQNYLIK